MPAASSLPLSAETVLLIDAAIDEREMYAMELQRCGYTVVERGDGESGLVEAMRHPPSVVVTDVVLPKLDGLYVLQQLRDTESTRDIPIIVLTGFDQPAGIIAQARAAGASSVRIKPCLPEALLFEIRRLRARSVEMRERAREARASAISALARAALAMPRPCPTCGAELQPIAPAKGRGEQHYFLHFRPCRNGCGSFYYDEISRRLVRFA
jgi:two-component system chemotaxis response regulator CheY